MPNLFLTRANIPVWKKSTCDKLSIGNKYKRKGFVINASQTLSYFNTGYFNLYNSLSDLQYLLQQGFQQV